jgi:Glycosyl hydrolases family 43
VCWLKIMDDEVQRSTVLTAEHFLGPYTIVRQGLRPLGMHAGDFDIVVDPSDGKAYYYFERVHSELICADLTEDCTNVSGYYSTHLPRGVPPYVREAPAYFRRRGLHYLITSGTTGYFPNASLVATAPSYHGPWVAGGDPHPGDRSRTSYNSQVSSVFRHPGRDDLYIAVADRWLPALPRWMGADFDDGRFARAFAASSARHSDPAGRFGDAHEFADRPSFPDEMVEIALDIGATDTSIADYVWLPIRFDGDAAFIDWHDEWRVEDFPATT